MLHGQSDDAISNLTERMPRFPGCESLEILEEEKKKCSEEKMLEFISQNIKYPMIARLRGIEGTCVVSFIIEKDGTLSKIKVIRDIGGGCGRACIRVIKLMKKKDIKWIPGMQEDKLVRVRFSLPISFKLE